MSRRNSKKKSSSSSVPADVGHSGKYSQNKRKTDEIDHLFDSYANRTSELIEPEKIETLCSDLGVKHTDIRMLMLAWKMKAEKQGYFTRAEWRRGFEGLRADSLITLKNALPQLEKEVRKPSTFKDFYSYAFKYCLTEEKQKCIDIESICMLLDLVLGSQFRHQVDSFIEYVKIQNDYKVINMDQWNGFYRFCNEISFPDLQGYDSDQSFPLIIDGFVEWLEEKKN